MSEKDKDKDKEIEDYKAIKVDDLFLKKDLNIDNGKLDVYTKAKAYVEWLTYPEKDSVKWFLYGFIIGSGLMLCILLFFDLFLNIF